MLKKTAALRSLALATCCLVFLGGSPSTQTQTTMPPVSPQPPTPRHVKGVIKGGASRHGPGISLAGGEPMFRPTNLLPRVEDYAFEDVTQKLDGLDCTNCTFKDVTLEYEGGTFNLTNATFSGRVRVVMKGAAANAFSIASMLAAVGSGSGSASPIPNQAVVKATIARQPVKLDWKSPYGSAPDSSTNVGTQR